MDKRKLQEPLSMYLPQSLDTYNLVKYFMKTGLKEEQAEAITHAIALSKDLDLSHLATKEGLSKESSNIREHMATKEDILRLKVTN